ncbi:MAG TPA: hypothetical protein VHD33_02655, partial [Legionellaceae bacterium]|nr:hypothetical protein [Legionellaceae bacterium]
MPLTIIFNGTGDTYYPDDLTYLKANHLELIGEGAHTLSFFADCIASNSEQIKEPLYSCMQKQDPSLLRVDNELVIIVGPDDTGTEVHNLIITGLMAVMNALLRGETEIVLVGFSRGSVEAVHMTHELQRIKNYLNHTDTSQPYSAIVNAICEDCYNPGAIYPFRWRTERLKLYYKQPLLDCLKNPKLLEQLKNGIDQLKLNGMLLDPVPGLCEGTRVPTYIPWTNLSHHTVVPPIIEELSVVYMDSEFSVGFRAVWIEPTPNSNTKINRIHFPGCHSTANGNPVNHNPSETLARTQDLFPYQNTRGVQKVFFYKLLQFGAKHNIRYKNPELLSGRFLTPIFSHFVENQANIAAQYEWNRTQYQEIADNIAAYRKTRETFYLPEWLSKLGLGGAEHINQERILMTQSGPKNMADCFNFNIKEAKVYVNFDSFFLDFINLLFPEVTQSPPKSPVEQEMSYSMVGAVLTAKYESPAIDMDYALLYSKINTLLAACQLHDLDTDLNRILLQEELDHKGILRKLIELIPSKLAVLLYHSNLSAAESQHIQTTISDITDFQISPFALENSSEKQRLLYEKKRLYIQTFQTNMHNAITKQTHKAVTYLLDAYEQFQYRHWYPNGTLT